jgi:hypothetical protein
MVMSRCDAAVVDVLWSLGVEADKSKIRNAAGVDKLDLRCGSDFAADCRFLGCCFANLALSEPLHSIPPNPLVVDKTPIGKLWG